MGIQAPGSLRVIKLISAAFPDPFYRFKQGNISRFKRAGALRLGGVLKRCADTYFYPVKR